MYGFKHSKTSALLLELLQNPQFLFKIIINKIKNNLPGFTSNELPPKHFIVLGHILQSVSFKFREYLFTGHLKQLFISY